MKIWQLGNTSVRSPLRLRDGLIALSNSTLQGNLRKSEGDYAFRKLLGECGVVNLGDDKSNSVGRKWRSAMGKLGFLYPEISKRIGISQNDIGKLDTITPAGINLINADTMPAINECFLRAMINHTEAVDIAIGDYRLFSPLKWTLKILLEIEKRTGEASATFFDVASIIQTSTPINDIDIIISNILELRAMRNSAPYKKKFDKEYYEENSKNIKKKWHTFIDYADMNIRYLKATGMVSNKGKGIIIVPEKHAMAEQLAREEMLFDFSLERYKLLFSGAPLPTDSINVARIVLKEQNKILSEFGIDLDISNYPMNTSAQVNQIRYKIEELISNHKEEKYAKDQSSQWEEISDYMEMLEQNKSSKKLDSDNELFIPKNEAPAYFEWIIWRAFLAVNSLHNKPYEARRFKIDQDFLPVSTAPGNGPDLIFELSDFVLVVEVTLTDNARQEASEGESVRRHVAEQAILYEIKYGKPVYGLFIAKNIDTNTAETFRVGVWYRSEEKMNLTIVPFTLKQFREFFNAQFKSGKVDVKLIREVIYQCDLIRTEGDGIFWKKEIGKTINSYSAKLVHVS